LRFSRATDSGIAGLPRNFVEVEGEEKSATTEARSGEGGFTAGVSGTDYDDVETVLELYWGLCSHGILDFRGCRASLAMLRNFRLNN
jgi:hypothetical protein